MIVSGKNVPKRQPPLGDRPLSLITTTSATLIGHRTHLLWMHRWRLRRQPAVTSGDYAELRSRHGPPDVSPLAPCQHRKRADPGHYKQFRHLGGGRRTYRTRGRFTPRQVPNFSGQKDHPPGPQTGKCFTYSASTDLTTLLLCQPGKRLCLLLRVCGEASSN